MGHIGNFPPSWVCTVTVKRGGRDARGDPVSDSDGHEVPNCMVGWSQTETSEKRSGVTSDRATLVTDDSGADIETSDRVIVPEGGRPSGEFQVWGEPERWPDGLRATLVRGDSVA